jgi:hypothetical protein
MYVTVCHVYVISYLSCVSCHCIGCRVRGVFGLRCPPDPAPLPCPAATAGDPLPCHAHYCQDVPAFSNRVPLCLLASLTTVAGPGGGGALAARGAVRRQRSRTGAALRLTLVERKRKAYVCSKWSLEVWVGTFEAREVLSAGNAARTAGPWRGSNCHSLSHSPQPGGAFALVVVVCGGLARLE